jgi:hypothetical protein
MKNILIAMILVVFVSGCAGKQIRIRSEVQEVQVPLLYCPAPAELIRPQLPIHMMTPEQLADEGEVVKHYKATVRVLLGYIEELETSLESYDSANEAYDELREKFQGEWKKEFEDSGDPE